MDNLYLGYINRVGKDWQDNNCYEFIFTKSLGVLDGEDWDLTPASNLPKPPPRDLIDNVFKLTSKLDLTLVVESDTFSYFDAIEGIVAIAWQNIMLLDEVPDSRLFFKFGESYKDVNDKLTKIKETLEVQALN